MQKQGRVSTSTGIIIIIVAIVILFGGVFAWQYFALKGANFAVINPSLSKQQIFNKPFPLAGEPADQTAGIQKNNIVGSWQSAPSMAADQSNNIYNFFASGKYSFYNSDAGAPTSKPLIVDCSNKAFRNIGVWKIQNDKIIINTYEATKLVNAGSNPDGVCLETPEITQKIVQKFNPPKTMELVLSICKNPEVSPYQPEGANYSCLSINGINYYKYSNTPSGTEPNF
jgi:hypothetical protein